MPDLEKSAGKQLSAIAVKELSCQIVIAVTAASPNLFVAFAVFAAQKPCGIWFASSKFP
ncbi:hypothetical protein TUM17387_18180 [Shewanella carassii]|nr:hypothetical protein TUM17387_18180 [Shewanella carassii]